MTDVPSGAGRPGDDAESVDDDALADAILASYTSSIPIIPDQHEQPEDAWSETLDIPPAASDPHPVPAQAIPDLDPVFLAPTADDERLIAETASWTSYDPSDSAPERTRWTDLDDEDAPQAPPTVWDIGDLGAPAASESFDFPAPEDAEPIDLLSDPEPKPWDELPAPAPGSQADDGETWVSTDDPITPFDPQPFPTDDSGPWTRLVEPETQPHAQPDAEGDETSGGDGWRPPQYWAPPAAAELFAPPEPAIELPGEPAASPDDAAGIDVPAPGEPDPTHEAIQQFEEQLRAGDDAEPEPEEPGAHVAEPDTNTDTGTGGSPEVEGELEDLAVDVTEPAGDVVPSVPPVGGSGGTATPWFDLDSAPPPSAPPATGVPAPETIEEPDAGSSHPGSPEDDPTGDSGYADDEDGSIDESDRVLPVVLPPGTIQTTVLPPSQPAVYADTSSRHVSPPSRPRTPRAFELERTSLEPTPLDRRAGRASRMFWLWFAANASLLSLATGGVLFGLGMSLRQTIVAALGGIVLSFLPLGLGTLAGKWSGQPTLVISRASFGLVGNILPSLIGILSRAVWGGVLLWVGGDALRVLGPRLTGSATTPWALIGVLVAAVLGGIVAIVGYGLLSRVQLVLTIISVVLVAAVIALTANRVDLAAALGASDGPWILVASGVVLVFSYVGLAWVHGAADLARYQAPTGAGSGNMLAASLGAGVPAFVLFGWGALLSASSPAFAKALVASPAAAITGILPTWFPLPLLIGALLASIAGSSIAAYSGGFALRTAGLRIGRPGATAIAVVLAALVAVTLVGTGTDARDLARDVVTTIAVPVAAWAGIFGAEVMIRNRRFHTPSLLERGGIYPDVRVVNLVALVVITALSFGFTTAQVPWLAWQGWFLWLLHIPVADPLATTDIGVFLALALGLLVPLLSAIPAIRRQEAIRA